MDKPYLNSRAITTVLVSMILLVCAVIVATIWMARNDHGKGPRNASEAIEIALDFAVERTRIDSIKEVRDFYDVKASRQEDGAWRVFFNLKPSTKNNSDMADHFTVVIDTEYRLTFFPGM